MWTLTHLFACDPATDGPEPTPSNDSGHTGTTTSHPGVGNLPGNARIWTGGERYDFAGESVDVGEVLLDQPGDEILVGAPSTFIDWPEHRPQGNAGGYLLVTGALSGLLDDHAHAFFAPVRNGDYWSSHAKIVGDVTRDGAADVFMVGLAGEAPFIGLPIYSRIQAGVTSFDDAAAWHGDIADHYTPGQSATRCGDVDGDAQDDFCVGGGQGDGTSAVHVYLHAIESEFHAQDAEIRLEAPVEHRVGEAGFASDDLDGDGLGDLAIGGFEAAAEDGALYVATGLHEGTYWLPDGPTWTGEPGARGQAGDSVTTGGDLDGDGRPDILVGASQYDVRTGRAYVVTTPDGGHLADSFAVFDGRDDHDWFGTSGAIGDFDGDGADDLAIGAPRDIYFGFDRPGRVAVFRGPITAGPHTEDQADAVWTARDVADSFGMTLAAGDTDADGRDDLVVGAPNAGPESTGLVALLPGAGL